MQRRNTTEKWTSLTLDMRPRGKDHQLADLGAEAAVAKAPAAAAGKALAAADVSAVTVAEASAMELVALRLTNPRFRRYHRLLCRYIVIIVTFYKVKL
ncbi:hypothetical protein SAY87_006476 [Trapa incisa]|uniref:Uncharacterized protein n=1 Tax=Trapa incisa TaxID=236973 RepID=A0AAN7PZE2_9MYRT|nr:hypothetical protein SAY87_006476 [Trapa incisa]